MLNAIKSLFIPTWVVSTSHVDPNELGIKIGALIFWYYQGPTPMITLAWAKRKQWRPVYPNEFGNVVVSTQDAEHPAQQVLNCLSTLVDNIKNHDIDRDMILEWVTTEVDYWQNYIERSSPAENLNRD